MTQPLVVKVTAPGGREFTIIGHAAEAILYCAIYAERINLAFMGEIQFHWRGGNLRMAFREDFPLIE